MASRLLGDYGYLVTGQPRLGSEEAGAAMFQPTTVCVCACFEDLSHSKAFQIIGKF